MIKFTFTVTEEQGIHARPAGMLVKKAGEFKSKITLAKDEKEVDCKRLFAVMSLGAKKGDAIIFSFDGEDETKCKLEIEEFCHNNL